MIDVALVGVSILVVFAYYDSRGVSQKAESLVIDITSGGCRCDSGVSGMYNVWVSPCVPL